MKRKKVRAPIKLICFPPVRPEELVRKEKGCPTDDQELWSNTVSLGLKELIVFNDKKIYVFNALYIQMHLHMAKKYFTLLDIFVIHVYFTQKKKYVGIIYKLHVLFGHSTCPKVIYLMRNPLPYWWWIYIS